jgi:hypothetical protein
MTSLLSRMQDKGSLEMSRTFLNIQRFMVSGPSRISDQSLDLQLSESPEMTEGGQDEKLLETSKMDLTEYLISLGILDPPAHGYLRIPKTFSINV